MKHHAVTKESGQKCQPFPQGEAALGGEGGIVPAGAPEMEAEGGVQRGGNEMQ